MYAVDLNQFKSSQPSELSLPETPVKSWSDTESAWGQPELRSRRTQNNRTSYPPSTRYNYQSLRANDRYRPYSTDFRGNPLPEESNSSILWQLTVTAALVILVYCAFQSDQEWAGTVRQWAQFTFTWDVPVDRIAHWISAHVTGLLHPSANTTGTSSL